MYEKDEIIINPNFQRLYRWSAYQQTRFLESIIIGIPIPPIFVAEDKDGRWELVDGLQRLSTIFSFFGILKTLPEKNDWILSAGDMIKEPEGYNCSGLPTKIKLNIKRASCRVEIIKWNSRYDLRFELFNRLNTGGSPLTNQEIRNSLFREISSDFNDFLKELASNENFVSIVDVTAQQINELYLEEPVLRFMSLYSLKSIHKSIAQHMTDFMKNAAKDENFEYESYRTVFTKTVDILKPLGKQTFKYSNSVVFSTAVYDTTMIGIAENIERYSKEDAATILGKIQQIKTDDIYRRLTRSGGNNSVARVKKRIEYSKSLFGKV